MLYSIGKSKYELVDEWAKLPEGQSFVDICDVVLDAEDRVYVLTRSEHPIMVFDSEGNLLRTFGEGLFKRAHGACIGPDGSIYCTDYHLHVVYKFDQEGKLVQTLGSKGQPSDTGFISEWWHFLWSLSTIERGGPPFNSPTGVALSSSGEIYVSDGYGNARVHKFSPDGKLLFSWGEPGGEPCQFRLPHNVWVDKQDRVWVADRENNRIQIFNAQGEFLTQWIDVFRPTDIFIDDETVYVSELCLRVSIFSIDGKLLARWSNEDGKDKQKALFVAPHAIAVDSRDDIYVGEVAKSHSGSQIDRGVRTMRKFVKVS